jgi:transketolase
MDYKKLKNKARKLRQDTFLAFIKKGEAHLGGSFSMIETLLTLYEIIMKKNDKFILSKAHASFPLCLLLKEKGLKPRLTTHLEVDTKNGIHCTAGSLGHGLPIATGIAFAKKQQKIPGKVYVMIGDGECQEGTTWESLLIGSKYQLDNLVILVDYNKIQALSRLKDALPLEDLSTKFKSFNWDCIKVKNGHSFKSLISSLKKKNKKGKPLAIIINTIKGKGIKEFEDDPIWHARKLQGKEIEIGKKKLGII